MSDERFGASPSDWDHFDLVLGLGEDLLPVVSNTSATISPNSAMKALGKTPSRYNGQRQAVGIAEWTSHVTTPAEIAKWSAERDYGICVQSRTVRAIDVDIEDPKESGDVFEAIAKVVGWLPCRRRENSVKFLLAFSLPGNMPKRVLKTRHGIIEFLATGQQFIAHGTHPSGSRYYWGGPEFDEIPSLALEQFEALWALLEKLFAIEPSTTSTAPSKAAKLAEAAQNDPTAVRIYDQGLVKSTERDGRLHITCPWESEHTSDSADSSTTYFPALTGGYERGHFLCLHSHCEGRSDSEFLAALGLAEDPRDDFDAVVIDAAILPSGERFNFVTAEAFADGKPLEWLVKDVLPRAELIVVYGAPKSGKTFWMTDLAAAVARGLETWCGKRVKKGRVGYVAAEGSGGLKGRLTAYANHHNIELSELPMLVMAAVPNLMKAPDVVELGNAINRAGGLDLLIYDTWARGTSGADENSAKDMGIAIENCRVLNAVTGATIAVIHHAGKDSTRGARGSNALLGAVDGEIEISRFDNNRTATIANLKDGADGGQFGFKLLTIPIGMDEDGDVISSCVIEHGPVVAPKPKEKKATENMDRAWTTLLELQPVGGGTVREDDVIVTAVEAATKAGAKSKNLRRDFVRAIDTWCGMGKMKRVAPDLLEITGSNE